MGANGRFFYEGIALGNLEPMSYHPQLRRQSKGFASASNQFRSHPKVGLYGYGYTISVKGQHQVDNGDFVIWTNQVQTLIENCAQHSKDYEDRAILEHAVLSRRLGILAWVPDVLVKASVTSVVVSTTVGAGLGQMRFTLSGAHVDFPQLILGDVVVIAGDGVGECGVVVGVSGTTWVEIVIRKPIGFGGVNYSPIAPTLSVYAAALWHPETSFRDASWAAPRSLGEAADTLAGINFTMDSASPSLLLGGGAAEETQNSTWNGGWEYGSPLRPNQLIYGDTRSISSVPPSQP